MLNRHQTVPVLNLSWKVLTAIIETIGARPAETGGVLGARPGETVEHYRFDKGGGEATVTYTPDHIGLNRFFERAWNPADIRLIGFVHSHPAGSDRPSQGDEVYAERILGALDDLDLLWLPIVHTVPDTGRFRLLPWAALMDKARVHLVRGRLAIPGFAEELDDLALGASTGWSKEIAVKTERSGSGETFARVRDAYDLPAMHASRILAVGAGGAAAWLEELARAGLGQFVMIDPDVVMEPNLATQQVYRRDIGRPKVDCIAERIRDINPKARTLALHMALDDLDDERIGELARDPIDGRETRRTVLCGLTDDFFAQARINRLALHLGLPSLSAQVYREGRGAEITFTDPGVTPACHRCILRSRYRHYLDEGKTNPVTSRGCPIFATARLNALKGFVLLALLHHGTGHPRWDGLLERIGERNLVQIRLDPDLKRTMGIDTFDCAFEHADRERMLFDETLWLPQEPQSADNSGLACPDCGGAGDLRHSVGTFEDTRTTAGRGIRSATDGRRTEG